ncbi:BspA family leucine-rich repeat surface protein [Enterococcus faecium]|uniref:BspA family leucine-rich repeat surface protein n=1 Tax=Enterococcus faecium TaxID=1352 RepID=A0A9X4B737_ENTFC|nr:BspA family leucine-rich repeat surface protein [Enterococcus faecium]MDC4249032.1 BspA family leucine-rich repeat surface protein [Enterococcus faecium]
MKRLINRLLCSVLVLGLASNSGVSSSHAEEKPLPSETVAETSSTEGVEQYDGYLPENGHETMNSSHQEETKTAGSPSTVERPETTSSDLEKNPSDSSSKKSMLQKSQFAATPSISTTNSSFDLNNCEYTTDIPNQTITLTGYNGQVQDLVIPSKITVQVQNMESVTLNVKVKINGGDGKNNTLPIPLSVHTITFQSVDGTKVGLETTGNWANLFNVSGKIYNNLVSIDLSGLDMSNVYSMNTLFNAPHVPNLESVNFGENTLAKVTDMSNAFNMLTKLKTINQKWTFGQLTSFNNTFFGCHSLTNLNLKDWNVSTVTNFKNMFYNCWAMDEFRMDNWQLNPNADLGDPFGNIANGGMFCLDSIALPKAALIVASDEKLLNYNYGNSGYKPSCGIRINANGGVLSKNEYYDYNNFPTGLSYYFSKVVIPTDQYNELKDSDPATLQDKLTTWLEDNVPTRLGYALEGWAPTDEAFNQKISSITTFNGFMASQEEFKAEWVSDKFDTSVDNTKLNPEGSLGLAYYPTTFTIGSTNLQSSGQQEISITKTDSFNVGVKDRTRTKDDWHVTAQLIWNGTSIPEAYIQTINNGIVMKNVSTGSGNYDSTTDLQSLQGSGITGMANYKITTMPNTIMESSGSTVNNGVYDYDLGDLKLVIPDVSQVRAGTYSGQVEWNLINGPA